VNDFDHNRQVPLACFVVDPTGAARFLAAGRRGARTGTDLRRLDLSSIVTLRDAVRLETFAELVPSRFRTDLTRRVREGGLLTPRQFRALVDVIIPRHEELGSLLRRYSSDRVDRILALSPPHSTAACIQKEAVGTALSLAGFRRETLQNCRRAPDTPTPLSSRISHDALGNTNVATASDRQAGSLNMRA
jgi:hypothetical protein